MRRYLLILLVLLGAILGVLVLGYFRSPTLGLDLQGGLEVVLEARPEAGQELTDSDLDRSVEIIRRRVDKLGVSEPEIRKQQPDQIVIHLAGVFDAERASTVIGQTAQLEFYDLQADVDPLSTDGAGNVIPSETLLPLLTPADKLPAGTEAREWYLYGDQKERLAGPAPTKAELLQEVEGGKAPEGSRVRTSSRENKAVLTCGSNAPQDADDGLEALPRGRRRLAGVVLPLHLPAERRHEARSGADGRRSERGRDAAGLRPADRAADRHHPLHERGRQQVPRHHARALAAGRESRPAGRGHRPRRRRARVRAALCDRPRRRDPLLPAYRLHRPVPRGRDRPGREARRSPGSPRSARRRTSRSSSRRARCRSSSCRSSAPTSRRRSARTRSARRGTPAIGGLIARRALPAPHLPLPRRGRGARPRRLRAPSCTARSSLQRDADAPGLRGPHAHDRRRGRREHRHLRTHQGRGARRQVRARGDLGRLREGLPHDPRRERGHDDHRRSSSSRWRPRGVQGLRADAAARDASSRS